MIYISWAAFADYVATLMVTRPVTYSSFWVIFLSREPSITCLFRIVRDLLPGGPGFLHSKTATVFTLWTMFYMLSFPTLMSSMSGYTPANDAFVKANDLSLIPFSEFNKVAFVIHDGAKIGVGDHFPVSYVKQPNSPRDPTVYRDGPSDADLACPYTIGEGGDSCLMLDTIADCKWPQLLVKAPS